MTLDDLHQEGLKRYLGVQSAYYAEVIRELRQGKKTSHWMWFIFPQIIGLGESQTSKYFAIRDAREARSYLDHPLLGCHLLECTRAMMSHFELKASDILGHPDDLKFRSSMTLFDYVSSSPSLFSAALEHFFEGKPDEKTLAIIKQQESPREADRAR